MKIIAVLLIIFLLFSTVMISGCVDTGDIKSQEDVSKAVGDISGDVENIEGILDDLDNGLG